MARTRIDRKVVQKIDPLGWRQVPAPEARTDMNLAIYGCSFVYGTELADDETLAAHLQNGLSGVRVLNRGVGGYGTVQTYLQFRRDIKDCRVDAAVFGIISDHRFRNIAHPQKMRQHFTKPWIELGVEHYPRAVQARDGRLEIEYVDIWQPSLAHPGFEVFLPDEYMIDQATICVLKQIQSLARRKRIPVKFALLDRLDIAFNRCVQAEISEAVDVSTPYDADHTFLPRDVHPNPLANRLFAKRLIPGVREMCSGTVQKT